MYFRTGQQQEAMENYQASLAMLINHGNRFHTDDTNVNRRLAKKRRRSYKIESSCGTICQENGTTRGAFAMQIPFRDAATFEAAQPLFNKVLVLPQDQAITPENFDVIYANLLFNTALVMQIHGIRKACNRSLVQALETYELAFDLLIQGITEDEIDMSIRNWLLYALSNNIATIYVAARAPFMTQYFLGQLRYFLTYSDSSLLSREDLRFYIVNLDVLTCPCISACAA